MSAVASESVEGVDDVGSSAELVASWETAFHLRMQHSHQDR
jgi:hypothetical protein